MTLSEIAAIISVPPSSCFNLIKTLQKSGYLYSVRRKEFYPTRKLLDICAAIDSSDSIVSRIAPYLDRLRDSIKETVIMGSYQQNAAFYLYVSEGPQVVRYMARAGEYKPLHTSSIGKVMLAALPEDRRKAWLNGRKLEPVTPSSIVDPDALMDDLQISQARGYFVTRGENVPDVMAISAPLRVGPNTFGVAVAGPLSRMVNAERQIAAQLNAVVREIEAAQNTPHETEEKQGARNVKPDAPRMAAPQAKKAAAKIK